MDKKKLNHSKKIFYKILKIIIPIYKKININVDVKGLNDFIDDFLFPQITSNLGPLYRGKHIILKIIHHSLLNYLLSSQTILIQMKQYYCKRIDDLNKNNSKIIKSLNEKINMLSFENEKLRKIYEEERKILEEKFQNKSKLSKEYIIDTQSDHLIRDLEYQVNRLNSKNINLGKKVTELEYEKLDLKKNIDALKKLMMPYLKKIKK